MSKDIDEKVDQMEAAVEQYASANTVISIGGYSFTPAKLMIAGTIVSTILGGLYGAFEVYKDYMDMKQQIQEYERLPNPQPHRPTLNFEAWR